MCWLLLSLCWIDFLGSSIACLSPRADSAVGFDWTSPVANSSKQHKRKYAKASWFHIQLRLIITSHRAIPRRYMARRNLQISKCIFIDFNFICFSFFLHNTLRHGNRSEARETTAQPTQTGFICLFHINFKVERELPQLNHYLTGCLFLSFVIVAPVQCFIRSKRFFSLPLPLISQSNKQ